MSTPQTDPVPQVDGLAQPADSVALACIAPSLTSLESALPLTPTVVVDYCPVDNHRALLRRWRQLAPGQQWVVGGAVGLTLGLGMMTWMSHTPETISLTPLALGNPPTATLTQSTLSLIYQRLGELLQSPPAPPNPAVAVPVSEVRPWLNPIMMDRFYLPAQAATPGQEANLQGAIVVDRFYFDPRQVHGASAPTSPSSTDSQPLMVPHPPPAPQVSRPSPAPTPSTASSVRPTAAPPAPSLSSPQTVSTVAPRSTPHRLLGVIQTGQYAAALVQTGQNSYAVKLGDRLSQGDWQLIEVQESAAVLSDGRQRLMLQVGDTF